MKGSTRKLGSTSAFVFRESAIRSLCRWSLSLCQSVISSVYDPGSFQAATCVLGLRGNRFMCKPCKSEISVSPQPSSSPGHKPLWVSELDVMGGIIFPVQDSWGWGAQGKSQTPHSSGLGRGFSMNMMSLSLVDHCPEGGDSD